MQVDYRPLVASVLSACNRATIDIDTDVERSLKTLIVVSMKYINKRELFAAVMDDPCYVDWQYIEQAKQPNSNIVGDSGVWLKMMQFTDFGALDMPDCKLREDYPPLWCIYNSLRTSGAMKPSQANPASAPGMKFSDACKMCILNNIEGVHCRSVTDQFTSDVLNQNTYSISSNVLSAMADERHGPEVYLATMKYLLKIMRVSKDSLSRHIEHYKGTVDVQRQAWKMKCIQSSKLRPSMRAVARSINKDSATCTRDDDGASVSPSLQSSHFSEAAGIGTLSLERFCDLVRFPISMSRLLRIRCYLLASQVNLFDYTGHTHLLVSPDVARSLNDNPVLFPSCKDLCVGIESLTMNTQPFNELNRFRERCFNSFASNQRRELTLTRVLQLYISAYQKKDLWKACWRSIYSIMSTQISKDVENFVQSTPFAIDDFVRILKHSTPFVDQS